MKTCNIKMCYPDKTIFVPVDGFEFIMTIGGNRLRLFCHDSVNIIGEYTVSHIHSGMRVCTFPKYHSMYENTPTKTRAKNAVNALIQRVGVDKFLSVISRAKCEK